jgi:hypothetical protein
MTSRALAVSFALCSVCAATPARAQDFDLPAPAWPPGPAGPWLERGLPPPAPRPILAAGITRWHGLEALTTRALAAGAGWRALRGGIGLSQTGEPDVGWTALGTVLGAVVPGAGASLRVAARRDRTSDFGFDAHGAAVGVEAGGGAWVDAGTRVHVWASAPQMWMRGAAAPLERPLEVGAAVTLAGLTGWCSGTGLAKGARGGREAGLATRAGPCALWLVARDRPLRGGLGVSVSAGALGIAGLIESHPVLRETARLSVALGGGP